MPNSTAGSKFGRRLLPHVIDDLALKRPNQTCFSIPNSSDPKDGWRPISFIAYATAIDALSYNIIEHLGSPERDAFPTLAYIGPNDARYVVLFIAAMKAGYKALFISPRNSHQAQMSLFESTQCRFICFPDSYQAVVDPWLREREMQTLTIESLDNCFSPREVANFPYERTFEETEWMPAVVLHTSGSTGQPKPFVATHGLLATYDAYHDFPEFKGCRTFTQVWSETPKGLFAPVPFFHAGGIYLFMSRAIYWGNPVSFGMADRPLSPDLVIECLQNLDVDSALIPPIILEYMSQSPAAIQALLPLKMAAFGGGELAAYAGNELAKHGVKLVNAIAATEFSPFTNYVIKDPELWQYFLIESESIGIDWRLLDGFDDLYRLVFARKDKDAHPGWQTCFYSFRDHLEFDTKDLFKPHPTLKDYWQYCGRSDNIIVLSNGEKLNPIRTEEMIEQHPLVKGALVVGSGRFHTSLILEPAKPTAGEQETAELIKAVWPIITTANQAIEGHSQLQNGFIMLSDPRKPFPRGGKGTIQRKNANILYQEEISRLYATSQEVNAGADSIFKLDVSSEKAFTESLRGLFETQRGSQAKLELDDDFYNAGIDSLQVIRTSRRLRNALEAAGFQHVSALVGTGMIYKLQSPGQLGHYLYSQATAGDKHDFILSHGQEQDTHAMEQVWKKYTENLPEARTDRPSIHAEGQTVILTGSTGMLGSNLLACLLSDPKVAHVHCLNRAKNGDGLQQRQAQAMTNRGLPTDFSKCTFHEADMSQPNFGLESDVYETLLRDTDRILLNAWPVNFNLPFSSFEPHIRGVRHAADFASRATKRIAVVFISTIDTCNGWTGGPTSVPEERLEDLSLPSTGYGRSKLVASLVLDDIAKSANFPACVIRVGQIAGSADQHSPGVWNKHEWIPSVVASSVYLKALPRDLAGKNRIDWVTVETAVQLVLDAADATQGRCEGQRGGAKYFHGVNPAASTTTWTDLVPAIQNLYEISETVEFEDWVVRLEKSQHDSGDVQFLSKNPCLKLLDLSRDMAEAKRKMRSEVVFDTTRTAQISDVLRNATPITPQLMERWCRQWELHQ